MPLTLEQTETIGLRVIVDYDGDFRDSEKGFTGVITEQDEDRILSQRIITVVRDDGHSSCFYSYKLKVYDPKPKSILISDQDWLLLTNLLNPTSLKISQS